jgi:TetR/AcrR family transcriptional regulator, regulator of cefoperazone and chloramphenicol sensitivity
MTQLRAPAENSEDLATRAKLIEAAARIFAERGFHAATVREICTEAGANVAAVNYHFRDKLGLYSSVLRELTQAAKAGAIMQSLSAGGRPEERLRIVIAAMLHAMASEVQAFRMVRIMAHELSSPTPVLDQVVDEFILPSHLKLCETVGEILGAPPLNETTRLCALNIVGQVMHFAKGRPVITRIWPRMKYTEKDIEAIAEHITSFTLSALHGLAKPKLNTKTLRGELRDAR